MKLSKQELEVLDDIQEGISDTHQLRIFVNCNLSSILKILIKLETLNLIKINKKFDKTYNEKYWEAILTEKGKKLLS